MTKRTVTSVAQRGAHKMGVLLLMPVTVALLFGFARIVQELRTGKLFAGEQKAYATREHDGLRYWFIVILEIFLALLVTFIVIWSSFKIFGKS